MLERLGDAVFDGRAPDGVLHHRLAQELEILDDGAVVSIDLPLARKADISLKKIGPELVVRVDGQKRTIILPPALAAYRPREAAFTDGTLRVTLDGQPGPEPA
jgi:arsenite/tail-anchored protein-transporting ATPase